MHPCRSRPSEFKYHNYEHKYYTNSSIPPADVYVAMVPESARSNKRVSRKARRGPDRSLSQRAPRDDYSLDMGGPPRSRRQGTSRVEAE